LDVAAEEQRDREGGSESHALSLWGKGWQNLEANNAQRHAFDQPVAE
jgi:hypothetical protein